jgi:hypothetical protein
VTDDEKKARIRELNDELRRKGHARNGRMIAVGALAQDHYVKGLAAAVAAGLFTDFNEENDPHGEHDCATFMFNGERFMFKIDYFALDEETLSEHPEDPNITIRIMSVMYAEDY